MRENVCYEFYIIKWECVINIVIGIWEARFTRVGDLVRNERKCHLIWVIDKSMNRVKRVNDFNQYSRIKKNCFHDSNQPFLWFESTRFVIWIRIAEPKSKICCMHLIRVKHVCDLNQTFLFQVMQYCDSNQTYRSKILFFIKMFDLSQEALVILLISL